MTVARGNDNSGRTVFERDDNAFLNWVRKCFAATAAGRLDGARPKPRLLADSFRIRHIGAVIRFLEGLGAEQRCAFGYPQPRPHPAGLFFDAESTVSLFLPLLFLDVIGSPVVLSRYLFHVVPNSRRCYASCTRAHLPRSIAVKLAHGSGIVS